MSNIDAMSDKYSDLYISLEDDISESEYMLTDSDKYYISELKKIPLLSNEETYELAKRISSGDKVAKDKLIISNLRLVASVASLYVGRGLQYLDLVQYGNLGLMKAVEKYDPDKGFKFSTYARHWIVQSIQRGITNTSRIIRLPVYKSEELRKYNQTKRMLANSLLRTPTEEEIAQKMNISLLDVHELSKLDSPVVSLNTLIYDDNSTEFESDFLIDDTSLDSSIIDEEIRNAVIQLLENSGLSQTDIDILKLRFGFDGRIPMTLDSISKIYNVGCATIGKRIKCSLNKLRDDPRLKQLAAYINVDTKQKVLVNGK